MKALVGQGGAELRLFVRDKSVLMFSLFFPVIAVAFFGYLNGGERISTLHLPARAEGGASEGTGVSYASFLIAGGIGMVVSSAAFQNLAAALARQRDVGILKRLGGTPLRACTLVGAKVATAAVTILGQALIMIALNVLLFGAKVSGNPFWTLAVLILGIVTFSTMGIALSGLCRNADAASAAGMAVALPMQFLCGTLFPLEAMPPALRHLAQVLPLTYFVRALRGAMLTGAGPVEYTVDWLVLLGCLLIAFPVAVKTFRWE